LGQGDAPADDRQSGTVLDHKRRQAARRKLRAQSVFVVIDHLRVLAELRQATG